ncbi:Gfo/Idh/MocA family oxidoreductase [candidate division KSB1 bacterium]|nr:Gfo/Idh/MocA family oxidoreductase [candidate division KSB1 bacterium]
MNFKICSIGCGDLATRFHGPALQHYATHHPTVSLAACCDLIDTRARHFQQQFGFQRDYTDFKEMLKREQPDAVCLIAPVEFTCELSCQILELGFPLLMEKPPGRNLAELKRMIAAAEVHQVPNQVAFNRRYTPLVRTLKQQLATITPAHPLQYLRYDFYRFNRTDPDFSTTAIHGIDTVRFLAGADYQQIRFQYQEFPEIGPGVANIFLDCTMANGLVAYLHFCPLAGVVIERTTGHARDHTWLLEIPVWGAFDTPGRLQHFHQDQLHQTWRGSELPGGTELYISNGFYDENACFFDDLIAGRRPAGDLKDARQSVAIAHCIRTRAQFFQPAAQT